MIAWSWVGGITLFAFVMSVTPGPNNILLAASGIRFGFRRTVPQIAGIEVGVATMAAVGAAGLGAIFLAVNWLPLALKIVGSLYLLWLGWRLWRTSSIGDAAVDRPMGFWRAVAFQFLNPKAWVMVFALVGGFLGPGPDYLWRALAALAVFFIVQAPTIAVWAGFGTLLRRWLQTPRRLRATNRVMAVLTALTLVLFWL